MFPKTVENLSQMKQLQNLLKSSKPAVATSLLLGLVLVFAEHNISNPKMIITWFIILLAVSLLRIGLISSYQHNTDITLLTVKRRLKKIRLCTFVSAIIWGSIGVLLFSADGILHLMFLILILAGLTAGNTVTNASDLSSSIGFSVLVLSPITLYLFLNGTDIFIYMGVALILYLGLLVIISRYINANTTQCSLLQHKAEVSEKEVRISEEHYRFILQSSPVGIVHYDKDLVITYCNDRFAQVMKVTNEQLIGFDIKTLKDQRIIHSLREVLEGKEGVYEGEYLSTLSKTQLWITMSYVPLRDTDGLIEGGIAIVEDITERKKTEEETNKLLNNLRLAEKIAQIGNWNFNLSTNVLEWSDEIFNIFELDKEKFNPTYEAFLNVIHPDDRIKVEKAYEQSLITKQKYEITHRLLMKDGRIKYVNEQCETKFDSDGQILYSVGTVQDVTRQMQYQIRLENSENTLRHLLEMSPIAVRIAKNEGQEVIFANEAYARLIQADKSDIIGKNPKNYYTDQEKYDGIVSQINNDEIIYNQLVELSVNTKTIWVLATYMPIEFDGESCVLGWFYDITEEKNLQKEVEQQRDEFKVLFNTSKDGIAILDKKSNFLNCNDAYLKMTGFTRDELLKTSCISLSAPEDQKQAIQALKSIFRFGYIKGFEKTCIVKDGKKIYIIMTATLLQDKQRILITTKDISAMKEHAQQLEQLAS